MAELLFFHQIRDLANLPSVKLTFKEADELSCKHQNMHSHDLQSPYGLLLKKNNQIKQPSCYRTDIPFFAFPALLENGEGLSGRMLQSALLLNQLVVFKSEIAFTSHMTYVPTD